MSSEIQNMWTAHNKLKDRHHDLDKNVAAIGKTLEDHLDQCRTSTDDMKTAISQFTKTVEALAVAQNEFARALAEIRTAKPVGILEAWCAGWGPKTRATVTIIILGIVAATVNTSISDIIGVKPAELITGGVNE